ncbi:MAG TPA: mechanosensitive ion channel domain-containing protein [Polyangiaceae bacterium]|nr:mechanosensitive ion channel domain-containing protein [Polyangiaceae bacterium]
MRPVRPPSALGAAVWFATLFTGTLASGLEPLPAPSGSAAPLVPAAVTSAGSVRPVAAVPPTAPPAQGALLPGAAYATAPPDPSAEAVVEPPASASATAVPPPETPPPAIAPSIDPVASAAPSASAALVAPAPPVVAEETVALPEEPAKIHDTVVFVLRHGHGKKSAAERAAASSEALTRAVETQGTEEVRVVRQGDALVVYAASIPVVELYPDDVEGTGFSTDDTFAATVAAHVREAVVAEKKRSAIASAVFSFSLLVFVGLVAFYVLRKIGEFFDRARKWTLDNPDRITGIRVQSQEVIGPTALRGGVLVTLIVGRFVAQIGVFYLWLVFALSLFQTTRPYTAKLTGFVVTPLSDLAARIAASLPLAVMAAVSGVTVYVLLRFVQLFFEGIARRQTVIPWLPPDLAGSTSVLVRVGIVVAALVLVAPLVSGDSDGALARAGSVVLLSFGLSATPLLASIAVGVVIVFGRRIRVGEHAEIGGRTGRVVAVGLIDVKMRDRDGCEVRVPHLLALVHPTRVLGVRPRISVEIVVAPDSAPAHVRQVLLDAVSTMGESPAVELTNLDADAASYRVTLSVVPELGAGQVRVSIAEALHEAGIAFGRSSGRLAAT